VERGEGNTNSPELSALLNFSLPSQPFIGRHFGFHIFFTTAFLGGAHFFTAKLFLD